MPRRTLPPLFAQLPPPYADRIAGAAPWELLAAPLEAVLDDLPSQQIDCRPSPDAHLLGDRIVLGAGTRIGPGAVIEGPVRIGRDCEVRPGAYIRGGCWIGDGCVIGAHSELKRVILLDGARAPHQNYVGDSILGADVNLGAGTILSNFRHDGREIHLRYHDEIVATGRRKLGGILGDGVKTGCNCVLHPGVIIGRGTSIYPGAHLRSGVYPADAVVKLRQEIEIVPVDGR